MVRFYKQPVMQTGLRPLTKLMLNEVQVDGLNGFLKILRGEQATVSEPAEVGKKRVIGEITGGTVHSSNPRKVMKLTSQPASLQRQQLQQLPQRKIGLLSLIPWDCLGIILDFTSPETYPQLRVCKSITSQIDKRVKGLKFH